MSWQSWHRLASRLALNRPGHRHPAPSLPPCNLSIITTRESKETYLRVLSHNRWRSPVTELARTCNFLFVIVIVTVCVNCVVIDILAPFVISPKWPSTTFRTLVDHRRWAHRLACIRLVAVVCRTPYTLHHHIAKTSAACFYHIRRLRQARRRVGQEVTQQLVMAFITSRLDYWNSLLAGLLRSTLKPLQRVQNAAGLRPIGRFDHVTPSLIQLHWLPVTHRVKFKL